MPFRQGWVRQGCHFYFARRVTFQPCADIMRHGWRSCRIFALGSGDRARYLRHASFSINPSPALASQQTPRRPPGLCRSPPPRSPLRRQKVARSGLARRGRQAIARPGPMGTAPAVAENVEGHGLQVEDRCMSLCELAQPSCLCWPLDGGPCIKRWLRAERRTAHGGPRT
jgi:hypothetical protein